jgi:hypothetical protein
VKADRLDGSYSVISFVISTWTPRNLRRSRTCVPTPTGPSPTWADSISIACQIGSFRGSWTNRKTLSIGRLITMVCSILLMPESPSAPPDYRTPAGGWQAAA